MSDNQPGNESPLAIAAQHYENRDIDQLGAALNMVATSIAKGNHDLISPFLRLVSRYFVLGSRRETARSIGKRVSRADQARAEVDTDLNTYLPVSSCVEMIAAAGNSANISPENKQKLDRRLDELLQKVDRHGQLKIIEGCIMDEEIFSNSTCSRYASIVSDILTQAPDRLGQQEADDAYYIWSASKGVSPSITDDLKATFKALYAKLNYEQRFDIFADMLEKTDAKFVTQTTVDYFQSACSAFYAAKPEKAKAKFRALLTDAVDPNSEAVKGNGVVSIVGDFLESTIRSGIMSPEKIQVPRADL